MKINEKVIWFGLGMILPIVIGGLYLLKQQNDSDSEPPEKYTVVPNIEVEPPEQSPPPVVEPAPEPETTVTVASETPPAEEPDNSAPAELPAAAESIPGKTPESPSAQTVEKPPVQASSPTVAEEKPEVVEPEPKPVEKRPPPAPTEYTLEPGDNPWLIAQKFGISTEELLKENKDLNPKNLQIGQVLKLPKTARIVSPEEKVKKGAAEKPAEQEPGNGEFEWYTIKSGENPWTISRKLKVDHQQVMELNKDLNFRDLKIGQKIKVPKKK